MTAAASKAKPFRYRWRDLVLSSQGPASSTDRLFCLVLETYLHRHTCDAYPSIGALAERMGVSERTAGASRQALEHAGWIEVRKVAREKGPGYRLVFRPAIPPDVTEQKERKKTAPLSDAEDLSSSSGNSHERPDDFAERPAIFDRKDLPRIADELSQGTNDRNQLSNREPVAPDAVKRVFEHWKTEHNHPDGRLTPGRRKMIETAIGEYGEEKVKLAISGYKSSLFHMGRNDDRVRHDLLENFIRDAGKIEKGLEYANPRAPIFVPIMR